MRAYDLPLFKDIPREHVDWALRLFRQVQVDHGLALIEEGEIDATLLCVLEGELEIRTGQTLLARVSEGEVVGEMGLFGEGLRMASVEALTNCELLLLDLENYEVLRAAGSPVARALENLALEVLMQRLSDTSDRIADLAEGTSAQVVAPAKGFFASVRTLFGAGGPRRVPQMNAAAVLRRVPFFADATEDAIVEIANRTVARAYSEGSFLCTEGSIGQEMYILAEGTVEVIISTEGDKVSRLATLEPGDAFGMIALLDSRPRMASVVSSVPTTVLVLGLMDWQDLTGSDSLGGSAMRVAMIRCVSDQLAFANAQLMQQEMTKKIEEEGRVQALMMANASLEAHGRHLTPVAHQRRE